MPAHFLSVISPYLLGYRVLFSSCFFSVIVFQFASDVNIIASAADIVAGIIKRLNGREKSRQAKSDRIVCHINENSRRIRDHVSG